MQGRSESLRALSEVAAELEIDSQAAKTVAESLRVLERLLALLAGAAGVDVAPEATIDASELLADPVLLHKVLSQVESAISLAEELDQASRERSRRFMQYLAYNWLLASPRVRNQEALTLMLGFLRPKEQLPGFGVTA
ncbi:MAG: hypothetical protein ACD_10C00063G0002 [uncultured bacterium]|nr:MAG: hypothetical protein ACD_10C00063G0002 [uncultured bacterium]